MDIKGILDRPYSTWCGIKRRCNKSNSHDYSRYGGRGITYDKKWETFEGFWNDMGPGYSDNLEIDRIDNDGDYTKENCRWVTHKEQMSNYSRNRIFELDGIKKTMKQWAEYKGINYQTFASRINKYKMSFKEALNK